MSKIYPKVLNKWSYRKIVAQKSMGDDNYRLAVRSGNDVFILSNPVASGISPERFKELEEVLIEAKEMNAIIEIKFIRKFGRKFIESINNY